MRGLKRIMVQTLDPAMLHSNNADPREGIKTRAARLPPKLSIISIQITLILVRGLKHYPDAVQWWRDQGYSNNADPREGIKTYRDTA